MANKQRLLLLIELGSLKEFTPKQIAAMETAMTKFSLQAIEKFKTREINEEIISFWKLLFNASWDNTILYMRYVLFKRAKRKAQLRANTENYKVYILRKSRIGWKTLSTLDVDYNKKIRKLNKNITAKKLEAMGHVANPPKNNNHVK